MAGEIELTFSGELANGELEHTLPAETITINQATQGIYDAVISCATSDAAVTTSGVTALGICRLKNLDGTNYVDFGPTSGGAIVPLIRVKAGEVAVFRLTPGISLRSQANTGACKVHITIFDA